MGRKELMKRLIIERANKKILGESDFLFPIGNDNFNVGYDTKGLGPRVRPKVLDKNKALHNSDYGGGDAKHQKRGGHKGIDIFAPKGTPVVACVDGVISKISNERTNSSGGNTVTILSDDGKYYYNAHLDTISNEIYEGEPIDKGTFIGTVGNTGNARNTHPHLHFSIYRGSYNMGNIDPWSYLESSITQTSDYKIINKVENEYEEIPPTPEIEDEEISYVRFKDLFIDDIIENGNNDKIIAYGRTGNGVKEVQKLLMSMGYNLGFGGADGIFGPVTKKAVKKFQKDNDLIPDGIVGIKTATELDKLKNKL